MTRSAPPNVTSGTLPSRGLVGSRRGPGAGDGGGRGRAPLPGLGAAAAPGVAVAGVPAAHAGAGRRRGRGGGGRGAALAGALPPSAARRWPAWSPRALRKEASSHLRNSWGWDVPFGAPDGSQREVLGDLRGLYGGEEEGPGRGDGDGTGRARGTAARRTLTRLQTRTQRRTPFQGLRGDGGAGPPGGAFALFQLMRPLVAGETKASGGRRRSG